MPRSHTFAHLLRPAGVLLAATWLLTGCDALGLETPGKLALKKEAEGRAIGGACRHAVRRLEDCYGSNPKASKAAIFEGWREMDEYMRENDIAGMPAQVAQPRASAEEVVLPASSTSATPGTAAAPSGAIELPPLPVRPSIAPGR